MSRQLNPNQEPGEKKEKWLTLEVFGFGLTSFFSDLSHEVATTILPVFLASLGAPAYAVGLMEGLADGLATFGKLLGGWVSDHAGKRKSLATAGYVLTALTQGLFAFVTVWPQALLARAIGWLGRGWRSPIRDALFHEAVPREASGRAFGFERMLDTLGAVIAPLVAFFFLSKIGFRGLFLWTWIPGALSVLCFLFFIKERKPLTVRPFTLAQGFTRFTPQYKKFLLAVSLFGMADFSHTLLIYWAGVLMTPAYGAEKAAGFAVLLYAIHNVIYAAASYPMGRLADRVGKFRVLGLGYANACLMFLVLMFTKGNFYALLAVFLLGGFTLAIEDSLERAVAGDLLSRDIKGTGYGALASLNGIGDMISSFMVGLLISVGSPMVAFGYCLVFGLAGTFLISFRMKTD